MANNSTGTLSFYYAWDSSTGRMQDLANCVIGERVDWPGGNPFYYPLPFPSGSQPNPIIQEFSAVEGIALDVHSMPGTFRKPYFEKSFGNTQVYRYRCSCSNGGQYVTLTGPTQITRTVMPNNSGAWRFIVSKSGASATIDPLP